MLLASEFRRIEVLFLKKSDKMLSLLLFKQYVVNPRPISEYFKTAPGRLRVEADNP